MGRYGSLGVRDWDALRVLVEEEERSRSTRGRKNGGEVCIIRRLGMEAALLGNIVTLRKDHEESHVNHVTLPKPIYIHRTSTQVITHAKVHTTSKRPLNKQSPMRWVLIHHTIQSNAPPQGKCS